MIYAITGKPGSGKTYFILRLIKKYLQDGRDCFCNLKIDETFLDLKPKKSSFFIFGKRKPKELGKLYYWDDLTKFRKVHSGVIFMDEGASYFNSRKWSSMSDEDLVKFQQHRHDGLDIIYSSQNFDMVDKVIRQLTNFVYICHSFGPNSKTTWFFWSNLFDPEYVNNKEKKSSYKRQIYFFNQRLANAYDSWNLTNRDFEKELIEKIFVRMNTFFDKKN